MDNIDQLQKTLEGFKKTMAEDSQLDEDEEEAIRKRNQEMMDRFNAINNSLRIDEALLKPSPYELKIKEQQQSGAASKLDDLDQQFQSVFAKMGELLFSSGFMDQIENQANEEEQKEREENKQSEDEDEDNKQKTQEENEQQEQKGEEKQQNEEKQ